MAKSAGARGSRLTIREIAELAGVSKTAVSFAFNGREGISEETRQRIFQVARDASWAPARTAKSLSDGATGAVGLVLCRDPELLGSESYYMRFLAGAESVLAVHGCSLLLHFVESVEEEIAILKKWRETRGVDAVILMDQLVDDPREELLSAPGAPLSVFGAFEGASAIWQNDKVLMRAVLDYLGGLGLRRIARVAGLPKLAHVQKRDQAYVACMEAAGSPATVIHTDFSPEQGADATVALLRSDQPPQAIVFDNDAMAFAALSAAHLEGVRVPDDLSVVAWDDSAMCRFASPALTAVDTHVYQCGQWVAAEVIRTIKGANVEVPEVERPSLIIRGSTGPRED